MGYLLLTFVYKLPCINIDRMGDLSYGIYIYAWPVQKLVWHSGQGPYDNFIISLFFVTVIAFFSWRIIEKRALGLRRNLVFKA